MRPRGCWVHLTPKCCKRYILVDWGHLEGRLKQLEVNSRLDFCSLSYITVDDAARAIKKVGMGATKLVKVDIKSTY